MLQNIGAGLIVVYFLVWCIVFLFGVWALIHIFFIGPWENFCWRRAKHQHEEYNKHKLYG